MNTLPIGGTVRVVSKRAGGLKADPDESIIVCDRTNRILGNHFADETMDRQTCIDRHRFGFGIDVAKHGPIYRECVKIAARVRNGERIALQCWCASRPCHLDIVRNLIQKLADENPQIAFTPYEN